MSQETVGKANSALEIAGYFIHLANLDIVGIDKEAEGITNLKLQKVLYFAQAYYLGRFDRPLFDDDIEAWQYGPVVPAVYHAFSKYGRNPIPSQDSNSDNSTIASEDIGNLRMLWDTYGRYSASFLLESSHSHAPWKEAIANPKSDIITKESMRDFYKVPSE